MTVNWTDPLEAVDDDGRVVAVELETPTPDSAGDWRVTGIPEGWRYFRPDGSAYMSENPWRIRNRQPETIAIPTAAWASIKAHLTEAGKRDLIDLVEPFDPDLVAARAFAVGAKQREDYASNYTCNLTNGAYDTSDTHILAYMAACKDIRERVA